MIEINKKNSNKKNERNQTNKKQIRRITGCYNIISSYLPNVLKIRGTHDRRFMRLARDINNESFRNFSFFSFSFLFK